MCPGFFSKWYALFFQCVATLWFLLDNLTLVYDLNQAISADCLSHSKITSLEDRIRVLDNIIAANAASFKETFRRQAVNAESRHACTLNEVFILEKQCRFIEDCLRTQERNCKKLSALLCSAVELNNALFSSENRRSIKLELLHWRLLAFKAMAMHYIRSLGETAHRRRVGRPRRSLSR